MTKKKRKPFWKRMTPELKSISDHIGKLIDNSNVKDVADIAIMGGLAYVGYNRTKRIEGALLGPVSYKVAQSMNLAAGIAGVSGLIFLGALMGAGATVPPEEGGGEGFWEKTTELHCEEGSILDWNIIDGWHCKLMRQPT